MSSFWKIFLAVLGVTMVPYALAWLFFSLGLTTLFLVFIFLSIGIMMTVSLWGKRYLQWLGLVSK